MLMSPAACLHFSEGDILGPGEAGDSGIALEGVDRIDCPTEPDPAVVNERPACTHYLSNMHKPTAWQCHLHNS